MSDTIHGYVQFKRKELTPLGVETEQDSKILIEEPKRAEIDIPVPEDFDREVKHH